MTTVSIIGSSNMATAIGTRAAKHGRTIELMSRNTAQARRQSWYATGHRRWTASRRPSGQPPPQRTFTTAGRPAR
jgi:8-hydroxy-5-deazaflavin:NADPH oxidoreductase